MATITPESDVEASIATVLLKVTPNTAEKRCHELTVITIPDTIPHAFQLPEKNRR